MVFCASQTLPFHRRPSLEPELESRDADLDSWILSPLNSENLTRVVVKEQLLSGATEADGRAEKACSMARILRNPAIRNQYYSLIESGWIKFGICISMCTFFFPKEMRSNFFGWEDIQNFKGKIK